MELTLAEELLLLVLDEEKGAKRSRTALDNGFAGALLVDLGRQELLRIEGKTLHPVAGRAPDHPVLARTYQVIAGSPKARTAKSWVTRLPRELRPITHTIAGPLVDRGVLDERRSKVLGLFPLTLYPERDPGPELTLRSRLSQVLGAGQTPDEHDALLLGLLVPLDLVGGLVERDQRRAAKKRAKEIADGGIAGSAVHDVIQDINAVMIAAVTAAAIGGGVAGSG